MKKFQQILATAAMVAAMTSEWSSLFPENIRKPLTTASVIILATTRRLIPVFKEVEEEVKEKKEGN